MNKFIVIVPVYNAVDYIDKCLNSILSQSYTNYELCVMDDCSTDGTWQKIGIICNRDWTHFNMCHNDYRIASPLANIVKAIELFALDKEDIICIVDGDDTLAHNDVFKELDATYRNMNTYMTYGQFVPMDNSYGPFCRAIEDTKTYRKNHLWAASHLKTFKRKVWDKINDADLRDSQGQYFKFVGDAAIMYPLIELCGRRHTFFINKVNYLYNNLNPLNEMSLNAKEQLRLSAEIWDKPCYNEVGTL